jgi:hypothetical protein
MGMTLDNFKAQCNRISNRLLGFDCFEDGDPYDLNALALTSYKTTTPTQFVRSAFEEDLAGQAYDQHLREEADRYDDPEE